MLNKDNLLYFKTCPSTQPTIECRFTTHTISYPATPSQLISYIAHAHFLSLTQQLAMSKSILGINKFLPIYITPQLILFPLYHKRAPLQFYINARHMVGLTSKGTQTRLHFTNNHHTEIDVGYHFIHKKWLESLTLAHIIQNQHINYSD